MKMKKTYDVSFVLGGLSITEAQVLVDELRDLADSISAVGFEVFVDYEKILRNGADIIERYIILVGEENG